MPLLTKIQIPEVQVCRRDIHCGSGGYGVGNIGRAIQRNGVDWAIGRDKSSIRIYRCGVLAVGWTPGTRMEKWSYTCDTSGSPWIFTDTCGHQWKYKKPPSAHNVRNRARIKGARQRLQVSTYTYKIITDVISGLKQIISLDKGRFSICFLFYFCPPNTQSPYKAHCETRFIQQRGWLRIGHVFGSGEKEWIEASPKPERCPPPAIGGDSVLNGY